MPQLTITFFCLLGAVGLGFSLHQTMPDFPTELSAVQMMTLLVIAVNTAVIADRLKKPANAPARDHH